MNTEKLSIRTDLTKSAGTPRWAQVAASLSLAASIAMFSTACSKEKPEETVVTVTAAKVKTGDMEKVVEADAVLYPLQQAAIVPKITAPVKQFYVKRGGKVRKGQLLATLENKDLAAAKEDSKGAYQQAEAQYVTSTSAGLPEEIQKATADEQNAREQYDAQKKLYDARQELFKQGALPRKDLDQAAVALTQARTQNEIAKRHLDSLNSVVKQQTLKGYEGQLSSAKGKFMGAEAQYGYSEIHSPIDGVVTDRPLYPGEMPAAGTPLITVMDVSSVTARAHIPQKEAALLKVGDEASIEVPGLDKPAEGKVTLVSPALDPNSTTVEVWVQAKNAKQQLKPGTSVRIAAVSETVKDALQLPAAAVLTGPDGATTVMVIGPDQKAHQTAVKTGIKQEDNIQIVEGLKEGQNVVLGGAFGLPDNTKIALEEEKKEGDKADDKDKAGDKDKADEKDKSDKSAAKPAAGEKPEAKGSDKGDKE